MQNRRDFIFQTAVAGGSLALSPIQFAFPGDATLSASSPSRVLILGGTGYIGPHVVRAAVARGHSVCVFTRGKEQVDLPKEVEFLIGDRNGDLESIKNRQWDAVLDLATYVPSWVRNLGHALKDRVGHYTFISSVAVYKHPKPKEGLSEDSPVLKYEGSEDPYSLSAPRSIHEYGALKALSEMEAEVQFPGRATILRPGYIVGPEDPNKIIPYWLVRMSMGGEVLISGDRRTPVQFIDVHDLAEFTVSVAERRMTGVFNSVGPATSATLGQLVDATRDTVGASPKMTWVPPRWIASRGDRELWSKLLFWSMEPEGWGWTMQMENERALAHGLTLRQMNTTLAGIWEWCRRLPEHRLAELLPRRKAVVTGAEREDGLWPSYLEREKETLREWHLMRKPAQRVDD